MEVWETAREGGRVSGGKNGWRGTDALLSKLWRGQRWVLLSRKREEVSVDNKCNGKVGWVDGVRMRRKMVGKRGWGGRCYADVLENM